MSFSRLQEKVPDRADEGTRKPRTTLTRPLSRTFSRRHEQGLIRKIEASGKRIVRLPRK